MNHDRRMEVLFLARDGGGELLICCLLWAVCRILAVRINGFSHEDIPVIVLYPLLSPSIIFRTYKLRATLRTHSATTCMGNNINGVIIRGFDAHVAPQMLLWWQNELHPKTFGSVSVVSAKSLNSSLAVSCVIRERDDFFEWLAKACPCILNRQQQHEMVPSFTCSWLQLSLWHFLLIPFIWAASLLNCCCDVVLMWIHMKPFSLFPFKNGWALTLSMLRGAVPAPL